MPRFLDILSKTLNLDNTTLSDGTKHNECRHKLEHTYVLLNGECRYITTIGDRIFFQDSKGDIEEFPISVQGYTADVSLINIDSGVYLFNKSPYLITRRPKKYFKKSFYPDSYSISVLSEDATDDFDYFNIYRASKQSVYRNGNGIFYLSYRIGQVLTGGRVKVNNSMFEQDIKEAIESGAVKI